MTTTTNATARIAELHLAAVERDLRATVAALSPTYLAAIGLGTADAVESYIAASLAAEVTA